MVVFSKAKAVKAFAIGLVMSGLVVACNEASQVAKTVAPEAEAVNASAGKSTQSAQLTAEEIDAKKREFFAKPEVKEMSAGLEEIAEAVAVAVEDKELRDRIYAKCIEKFDGETNVLWQQLESDGDVRSKGGWNKRIDDLVSKGRKNTIVKGVGNVDAAVKKFEKVFNAPVHLFWAFPANWDKKTTPLVAYFPLDGDPEQRKTIPAFDAKGNRYELDNHDPSVAKQRPILVVAFNERTGVDGSVKQGLLVMDNSGQRIVPFQSAPTNNIEKSLKSGKSLTAAATTMIINWVTVPSQAGAVDEPWGEGGTEWIAGVDKYSSEAGAGYVWSGFTTTVLGPYQALYTPTRQFYIAGSWYVHIKYFEDDFTPNQYDIFDDWYGWHKIEPPSAPIQVGNYDRTESFGGGWATTANYTFQ
jgi:hypothetical protein